MRFRKRGLNRKRRREKWSIRRRKAGKTAWGLSSGGESEAALYRVGGENGKGNGRFEGRSSSKAEAGDAREKKATSRKSWKTRAGSIGGRMVGEGGDSSSRKSKREARVSNRSSGGLNSSVGGGHNWPGQRGPQGRDAERKTEGV